MAPKGGRAAPAAAAAKRAGRPSRYARLLGSRLLWGAIAAAGLAVAGRALLSRLVSKAPPQVCPEDGALARRCRRGEVAPYWVDLDVECMGSQQSAVKKVIKERTGDAFGKKLTLWLSPESASETRALRCVVGVVRDFNCTACSGLNMTVSLGS
ncbi:hypothetical protein T492DRAFT_988332 [Pavlovales sp. CCMP2436]|nr:hypothetical protein T492DRAFT_988332 [Pavlovales sp. CCMP2436]